MSAREVGCSYTLICLQLTLESSKHFLMEKVKSSKGLASGKKAKGSVSTQKEVTIVGAGREETACSSAPSLTSATYCHPRAGAWGSPRAEIPHRGQEGHSRLKRPG